MKLVVCRRAFPVFFNDRHYYSRRRRPTSLAMFRRFRAVVETSKVTADDPTTGGSGHISVADTATVAAVTVVANRNPKTAVEPVGQTKT